MTRGALRASVFLFLFSTAAGGANLLFTAHEVAAVRAAEASVTQLCQSGNEARGQVLGFAEYLAAISKPSPHETLQARRQRQALVARFLSHMRQKLAPRDCRHPGSLR
jgi:hypothetical protein